MLLHFYVCSFFSFFLSHTKYYLSDVGVCHLTLVVHHKISIDYGCKREKMPKLVINM